ncbi:MAG: hypothetical protein AAF655_21545 [Bacteroidota bacterium]
MSFLVAVITFAITTLLLLLYRELAYAKMANQLINAIGNHQRFTRMWYISGIISLSVLAAAIIIGIWVSTNVLELLSA